MNILERIKEIPELENVPEDQLQWLIDAGEVYQCKQGDMLFKKGSPIDRLLVILDGHFIFKREQNGNFRIAATLNSPSITGLLPYSRAKEAVGYAEASMDSTILAIGGDQFAYMKSNCDELTTALVHIMSTRIRTFTKQNQQDEKIMALGKLSAGLAHELNNPSSAVVRSAQTLSKHLRLLPDKFKQVIKIQADDETVDSVNNILFKRVSEGTGSMSMMEKSSLEDEIYDWLEDHEVADPDDLTENFVEFGFTEDDLDEIDDLLRKEDLGPVLGWFNQVLTTERLVGEIEEASKRINELVTSVKSYTHMDQAPEKKPSDIHNGIDSTLTMLNHKLKKNNVTIHKKYDNDLPKPQILASAMNQVWTNLMDNAIDAMESSEKRELTIETWKKSDFINVHISDSGGGIPDDIKDKIFDPFFTTKEIGKGTGIGLEVVHQIITQQHNGTIDVESTPGRTTFKVCFPIES